MRFHTIRYYSPWNDGDAERISAFDDAGNEFWMPISPLPPAGRARREARERARAAIEEAVTWRGPQGERVQPGRVVME